MGLWLMCLDSVTNPIKLLRTSPHTGIDVSHTSSYQFNEPGIFEIVCMEDDQLRTLINVGNITMTSVKISTANEGLEPILYSHASVMGLVFGVLLPIGVYAAYHYFTILGIVIEVISVIGSLVGLVLIVVYAELSNNQHFRFPIHGVVGLALVLLLLVLPFLRVHRRVARYHRKLGQVVAFFGMANVLLVSKHSV